MQRDTFLSARQTRPPRSGLVRAGLIAGMAAAAGGAALFLSPTSATAASGQHNSDAPVNFLADHMEVQDKENRVLLSGNVVITQDDVRVRSARAVISYTNNGKVEIQRLDATGDVHVDRGTENAVGDVAIYDFSTRKITMVGHVVMHNANGNLTGSRVTIDLDSKLTMVTPTTNGRVSGSFTPPKSKTAADKKASAEK
ncbi:MAG TPA: LptA/OstA family protein [Novosphingobium sp.]|nr:LptA/OstA family protein [Novosphingobium sp.]